MKIYNFLLLTLLFNFGLSSAATQNDFIEKSNNDSSVIKILAIGNSFSVDAIESHLFDLAKAENIQVIIGNLYIGGASLNLHWNNAKEDKPAYQYRKIDVDGNKINTSKTSISAALADEDWDYISFQQVSYLSGVFDSYVKPLPPLFDYVKQRATNPKVKYVLHQTWAYAQDATHSRYINYNNDQLTMYEAIVDAAWRAKELVPIDIVIPAGTAIQNGRTSTIGDNFCRDGYHLDKNIGRYTAACAWFEAILKKNVIGNSYKPDMISDYHTKIAQHAAHYAVMKPKVVTQMSKDYKEVAMLSKITF